MGNELFAGLPDDLAAFLRQHIPSLHQFEILLLIYTDPPRVWTAKTIAQHLYLPPELVAERLADLSDRGLVQRTETDERAGQFESLLTHVSIVQRLARFYAERRVTIISFIFAQPNETVRSFADAFKLRKES
ncbi:MAG TPA: MarR family transcriptional regulator [Herpetosiphonaceae bacterium]